MRIVFMGRRPHAVEALAWLLDAGHDVIAVVCPSGVGNEIPYWEPTVRGFAVDRGLPIIDSKDIHDRIQSAGQNDPLSRIDLVVSFLYWKRIQRTISTSAKFGCINFHPAPLPEYRGLGGYNFAILEKRTDWAATAHYVDDSFDTGPIIEVRSFPFDWESVTALELERMTRPHMLGLFRDTVSKVAEWGILSSTENTGGRYYTRQDMNLAKEIDLEKMSPEEIDIRIRAFWYPPFEGANILKNGVRYTLATDSVMSTLGEMHRQGKS